MNYEVKKLQKSKIVNPCSLFSLLTKKPINIEIPIQEHSTAPACRRHPINQEAGAAPEVDGK